MGSKRSSAVDTGRDDDENTIQCCAVAKRLCRRDGNPVINKSENGESSTNHSRVQNDVTQHVSKTEQLHPRPMTRSVAAAAASTTGTQLPQISNLQGSTRKRCTTASKRAVANNARATSSSSPTLHSDVGTHHALEDLTEENEGLQEEVKQLRVENQAMQQRLLEGTFYGREHVQDDKMIISNFRALSKRISDWASGAATKGTLISNLSFEELEAVRSLLLGRQKEKFSYVMIKESKFANLRISRGGPRCVLQTIVEHVVAYEILSQPFHFLPPGCTPSGSPSKNCLQAVRGGMHVETPELTSWTARTLRLLYDFNQYSGNINEPVSNDKFQDSRQKLHDRLVHRMVGSSDCWIAKLLNQQDQNAIEKYSVDLHKIFAVAGKLSLQLWVQDIRVTSHGLDKSVAEGGLGRGSDHIEPHTVMSKHYPKDSTPNRNTIALIVSPEIRCERCDTKGNRITRFIARKAQVLVPLKEMFEVSPAQGALPPTGRPVMSQKEPQRPPPRVVRLYVTTTGETLEHAINVDDDHEVKGAKPSIMIQELENAESRILVRKGIEVEKSSQVLDVTTHPGSELSWPCSAPNNLNAVGQDFDAHGWSPPHEGQRSRGCQGVANSVSSSDDEILAKTLKQFLHDSEVVSEKEQFQGEKESTSSD